MTRRNILAAPIAALLGKAAPRPARKGVWYMKRFQVVPPPGVQFYLATNFYNWRPILEQINLMPDVREGRV